MENDKSSGEEDSSKEKWEKHFKPVVAALLMPLLFSLALGGLIRLRGRFGYSVYFFEQAVEALYSLPLLIFVFLFAALVLGISYLLWMSERDRLRALTVAMFEAALGLVVTLSASIFGVVLGVLPYASDESESATPYVLGFSACVAVFAAILRWNAKAVLSIPKDNSSRKLLAICLVLIAALLICFGPWPDRPADAAADRCVSLAGSAQFLSSCLAQCGQGVAI